MSAPKPKYREAVQRMAEAYESLATAEEPTPEDLVEMRRRINAQLEVSRQRRAASSGAEK